MRFRLSDVRSLSWQRTALLVGCALRTEGEESGYAPLTRPTGCPLLGGVAVRPLVGGRGGFPSWPETHPAATRHPSEGRRSQEGKRLLPLPLHLSARADLAYG